MSDDSGQMHEATEPAAAPDPKAPSRTRSAQVASPRSATEPQQPPQQQPKVRFDSSSVKSTYCNVCNATSTREEVVINFGINKTWDQGGQDLEVQLEHRIILSPFAAKRLQDLLVRLMADHEQRYGKLS